MAQKENARRDLVRKTLTAHSMRVERKGKSAGSQRYRQRPNFEKVFKNAMQIRNINGGSSHSPFRKTVQLGIVNNARSAKDISKLITRPPLVKDQTWDKIRKQQMSN